MTRVKILIVDDHAILRDGIRALLSSHDEIEIVGEASDGGEAIQKALEFTPDVILMDLVMPGMNGLEAIHHLRKKIAAAKVLVLTQHDTKTYILSAVKAGAAGYIPKKALSSELLTAIRTVHKGDSYLYSSATKALMEDFRQQVEREPYDRLTAREREILKLVASGQTSREISDILHISLKTVQGHRLKITKKLGLGNRTELIKYAMRKGLVDMNA